ncbi:MAG: FkbM family methyltransferase [Chthoniobacterales bacterium]
MSLRLVFKSVWQNPGNQGRRLCKSLTAIGWQIRKRVLRKPTVIRLANGARFKAHPDCVVSSALIYSDWPEFRELQFIRRTLKQGDAVIDVGANVGHISLLLSDLVGPENIFAFEPTPVSFRRLTENWELNSWPVTNLLQNAVGRQAGSIGIPDTTHPDTKNSISSVGGGSTVEVPLIALDARRAQWNGRRVGLLKIDVEGYEREVFAGAQELLRHDRPRLVMFESLAGTVDTEIAAILRGARYDAFQLSDTGKPDFSTCTAQNVFAVPVEERSLLPKCDGS